MKQLSIAATLALIVAAAPAWAQVSVSQAWVRGTVQGQKATGAFMQLKSTDGATLVAAQSPVAGVVEIHEMKMENNVMKMRGDAEARPAGGPGGRPEAGRLSRDAHGPEAATEEGRQRADHAQVPGQGREASGGRGEGRSARAAAPPRRNTDAAVDGTRLKPAPRPTSASNAGRDSPPGPRRSRPVGSSTHQQRSTPAFMPHSNVAPQRAQASPDSGVSAA